MMHIYSLSFSLKVFFLCTIFKDFTEFITILLLFYVLGFFGLEVCAILSALEGKVLTTGLPGKVPFPFF